MYINTLTRNGIKNSLCKLFNMNEQKLLNEINKIKNVDDVDLLIENIIRKFLRQKPDELLFFHLSRRLNTMIDEIDGVPSSILLTTENDFSRFFKKYGIEFVKSNGTISFKYKGYFKSLDWNAAAIHLKNKLLSDDCFNGHAFNNSLINSIYNYTLEECPEIVNDISNLLVDSKGLVDDYVNNSTYICYIYKIPMDMVIVDNKEEYNEKLCSLIKGCIFVLLNDNSIANKLFLRLKDGYILPSRYFFDKYVFK